MTQKESTARRGIYSLLEKGFLKHIPNQGDWELFIDTVDDGEEVRLLSIRIQYKDIDFIWDMANVIEYPGVPIAIRCDIRQWVTTESGLNMIYITSPLETHTDEAKLMINECRELGINRELYDSIINLIEKVNELT